MAYNVALFIHVLGVVTLFIALALVQRVGAFLRASATVEQARLWLGILRPTGRMFPAAAAMLVLTGLYMADQAWSFTTPWVVVAFWTLVALMAVGSLVTGRGLARIGAATASAGQGPLPEELRALMAAPGPWVASAGSSGAAIGLVWLMTTKPDWAISIAVVVVLAGIGAALGNAALRRPQGAAG